MKQAQEKAWKAQFWTCLDVHAKDGPVLTRMFNLNEIIIIIIIITHICLSIFNKGWFPAQEMGCA